MLRKRHLLLGMSLAVISAVTMADTPQKALQTSVDKLIDTHNIGVCAEQLSDFSRDIIGHKTHRLLLDNTPDVAQPSLIKIFGLIEYRDRQAHISFAASEVNGTEQCQVSYHETFTVQVPCVVAREEVFKKWRFKGKLNDTTSVFEHKRDAALVGYMSSAGDNSYCLISQQKSIIK